MLIRAQLEERQQESSADIGTATVDRLHGNMFSALLGELLNSALLVATTASIGNAISESMDRCSIQQLASYLPPQPGPYEQSRLQLCSVAGALKLTTCLGDYYDQLGFMRDHIKRWYPSSARSRQEARIEITAIAEAWRDLALRALSAIEELSRRVDREALALLDDRAEQVKDLLRRTAAGESPCIDAYGTVTILPRADRRREARGRRGVQAYFQVGDSLQRAAVLDASQDGIGVLGLRNVAVGSRIGLLVKPGISIDGTVMWVNGPRAGIKLDAPPPADSQLVTHLS